jgi:hypothetical protein
VVVEISLFWRYPSPQMVTVNLGFAHYWLDHVYGALMHRLRLAPPFFSKGWGGPQLELLEKLIRQNFSQGLVQVSSQHWPPPSIRPAWKTLWESRNACLREGTFLTPCDAMLREVLPCESHTTRVRMLSPRHTPAHQTACVVHLAGTGDHGFERRLRLGAPLLKQNIATMVLESCG